MIRWEIAQPHHAPIIARSMRPRDVAEIRAGWGEEPEAAILRALEASYYARVCFVGLEPLAVYGLSAVCILSQTSQVWIFATRYVDTHKVSFLKASRLAVKALHVHALRVTNYIDAADAPANKWLTWLGGRVILSDIERGGRNFSQFLLEARCQRA